MLKYWGRTLLAITILESLVYGMHFFLGVPLEISFLTIILAVLVTIAERRWY